MNTMGFLLFSIGTLNCERVIFSLIRRSWRTLCWFLSQEIPTSAQTSRTGFSIPCEMESWLCIELPACLAAHSHMGTFPLAHILLAMIRTNIDVFGQDRPYLRPGSHLQRAHPKRQPSRLHSPIPAGCRLAGGGGGGGGLRWKHWPWRRRGVRRGSSRRSVRGGGRMMHSERHCQHGRPAVMMRIARARLYPSTIS
jgi:hypothetical protein